MKSEKQKSLNCPGIWKQQLKLPIRDSQSTLRTIGQRILVISFLTKREGSKFSHSRLQDLETEAGWTRPPKESFSPETPPRILSPAFFRSHRRMEEGEILKTNRYHLRGFWMNTKFCKTRGSSERRFLAWAPTSFEKNSSSGEANTTRRALIGDRLTKNERPRRQLVTDS